MHGKNIAQIFLTLIREICIAGYYPGYVFFIFISFYMCISVDRFIFFTATLWHLNAGISWSVGMVDVTTSGLFSFVFFLFSCSKMFVCDLFFFWVLFRLLSFFYYFGDRCCVFILVICVVSHLQDVSRSRASGCQLSGQLLDVSRLARYQFQHLASMRTKPNKSSYPFYWFSH